MSDQTMTGAEIILQALRDQGVEVVFGYPGGAVLPLYDALYHRNDIRHILVRHEQGAVHAAEGYARSTGKVGCVIVTSGPGATNAVTGLTDALMDSTPIVCLSGQVPTHLIGNDAFQEADTTGITRPCTKHNYLVKDINQLARILHEAFYVARSGRPGPVLVDIPKDIQVATGPYVSPHEVRHKTYRPQMKPELARVEAAIDLIADAKRPIFYTGGGVVNSGVLASKLLTQLIRTTGYPVTSTLMGLGAYPASDNQFVGMVGMHGTYEANLAMYNCDVMINVGARFDDRVTGKLSEFSPGSKKIHIDIDPSSINKTVSVDVSIVGDAAHVLEDMIRLWKTRQKRVDPLALKEWWAQIALWRKRDCLRYQRSDTVIKPQFALERLREAIRGRDAYITTEVGQHQMWAAQFLPFDQPNRWITSGGLGTMGFGLPAAVGVQIAHPDALVIGVAGESSLMMNIQELSTAVQARAPIKIFILDNNFMGMVRQWQELLHGSRYSQSVMDVVPDFVKLADAFGAVGLRVSKPDELDDAIQKMLAVTDRPVLLDVAVDPTENCFPMIPGGRAHNEILLGPQDRPGDATPEEGLVLV